MSQDSAARGFDFQAIEARWQKQWDVSGAFTAMEDPARPKFYALEM